MPVGHRAVRDGLRLIAVTLGARTAAERDADITRLLNYGFSRMMAVELAKEGESVAEIEVSKAKDPLLSLVAGGPLTVSMERGFGTYARNRAALDGPLRRPLAEGEEVGYLIATLEGEEVGRVPVLTSRAAEKASVLQMIGRYFLKFVGAGKTAS